MGKISRCELKNDLIRFKKQENETIFDSGYVAWVLTTILTRMTKRFAVNYSNPTEPA